LKSEDDVKYLIAGLGIIFICEECVSFCNCVLDNTMRDFSKARPGERLPTERLLSQLRSIDDILQGKSTQLQWAVDTLRLRKISWGRIAEAIGVSRQSAWERFFIVKVKVGFGLGRVKIYTQPGPFSTALLPDSDHPAISVVSNDAIGSSPISRQTY
jgi:ATP-dependent Clp protease ATP-binding subunit ClpX